MKLRKLLFTLVIVVCAVSSARANVFFDLYGIYNYTGYAKAEYAPWVNSYAPGFLAGFNIPGVRDFSLIGRFYKTAAIENPNKDNEKSYSHLMVAGGLEYIHQIVPKGMDFGLGWRSSVLLGGSKTQIEKKIPGVVPGTLMEDRLDDSGFAFQITTGVQANVTPNISFFVDLGYHKSYYINDFQNKNISGYLALAGIRIYISNIKSIGDNY